MGRIVGLVMGMWLVLATGLAAQEDESSEQAPQTWSIVHAGTLLAIPGETPLSNASVIIKDGRVAEVRDGFAAESDVGEEGDEVSIIDLSDRFVMPGMMDMHTHLTFPSSNRKDFTKYSEAEFTVIGAVNARKTLYAGFTTVRNVGSRSAAIFAVRDAIARGEFKGPRILAAGDALSITSGHGDTEGYPEDVIALMSSSGVCDGVAECRKATRTQIRRGADVIKINASGGGNEDNGTEFAAPEMEMDEMVAAIGSAHALGRTVAAHAHGTASINRALEAGIDSIEHGGFLDSDSIRLFKRNDAFLVPTMSVLDVVKRGIESGKLPPRDLARNSDFLNKMPGNVRRAHAQGVQIALGSDAGVVPHGKNARELEWYVEIGMTPNEALRAATLVPARLIKHDADLGSIEAGKIADIIAVSGNPLEDISIMKTVEFVMTAGKVQKRK